ncbi:MAG: 2-oxoglutarate dehydrogenase E1 component [Alphaproteobacteria bacterium]
MTTPRTFSPSDTTYVEDILTQYEANPASVSPEWRAYFIGLEQASVAGASTGNASAAAASAANPKALGVYRYIRAWRMRGHRVANTNPLKVAPALPPELTLEHYGLSEADMNNEFPTCGVVGQSTGKLNGIYQALKRVYGGTTGIETAQLANDTERTWVRQWWENPANFSSPTKEMKKKLYQGLLEANHFEKMLHTKFVGVKRFSLEGNDAVIPVTQRLIEAAASAGVKHVVMGMAHRGRLNTLCNIMHKPVADMVAGFADKYSDDHAPSANDVKYHLGKVYNHHAENGDGIELELMYNPSHLEVVNPLVLGAARAKAVRYGQGAKEADFGKILPVLMHGDAAVAGQGTVAECNNMMSLDAYNVGGTLHVVINNQIGFTADTVESISGEYCTDIFKSLACPIVHVNADDVEACWRAARFCWEYRQAFGKDTVLDVVGYRRWGHNEGDDPTFTQPHMYGLIRNHPVPCDVYKEKLVEEGSFTAAELEAQEKTVVDAMNAAHAEGMKGVTHHGKHAKVDTTVPKTAISKADLAAMVKAWSTLPAGVELNAKVAKVVEERIAMWQGEKPLNWGAGENAAYGSLLASGITVRLTGEDVQRGTFSHRHAVMTCSATNNRWSPMQAMATKGARCALYNSSLSENAVMGFEYGYAHAAPQTLTIWEAQFGDFANGAQMMIDQYISAAEVKWGQMNGLTLLLPHGQEGQGPEHSSARLERYLQLCAEDNMRVVYPTTPAQIFHLLRRQALWGVKRPLVVMTPKSLLRNPAAVSDVAELTGGSFHPVMDDAKAGKKVKRVVLCSGKVYYDLAAKRDELKDDSVALVRVEELYPFPAEEIGKIIAAYKCKDIWWVQEEPRNQGAWWYVQENWNTAWGYLHYQGRPNQASPAVGINSRFVREQKELVESVFASAAVKKVA